MRGIPRDYFRCPVIEFSPCYRIAGVRRRAEHVLRKRKWRSASALSRRSFLARKVVPEEVPRSRKARREPVPTRSASDRNASRSIFPVSTAIYEQIAEVYASRGARKSSEPYRVECELRFTSPIRRNGEPRLDFCSFGHFLPAEM